MYDGAIISGRANEMLYAFMIDPPADMGDGTVSDCSGSALNAKPKSYTKGPNGTVQINESDASEALREHSQIFKSHTAKKITLTAIENICKYEYEQKTSK